MDIPACEFYNFMQLTPPIPTVPERLGDHKLFPQSDLSFQATDRLLGGQTPGFCPTWSQRISYDSGLWWFSNLNYSSFKFEVLVNMDNFEFVEWIEEEYGAVPHHTVKTCPDVEIYVGKNKYSLGKVVTQHKAFFLPLEGDDYWYKSYQANDQIELFNHPLEALQFVRVTNLECSSVEKTVLLEKTSTVEKTWDIVWESHNSSTTMTAKVPILSSGTMDFTKQQTVSFSESTTMVESISHSISVELLVPPNHSCTVQMEDRKMTADIPFTGRLSQTYHNGDSHWTTITGTYDDTK
ncbi:natterin-3-like [Oncorhynchus tshawytscha]|uniref:natterin-3-like n=1 Tax=Oncorhynchus tshawytscha TaxID=74940 RepID=UPI001C3D2820|nr:natterin-3-like [Oncorhynchus tshawytscha]